jgi:adenylate cyclase
MAIEEDGSPRTRRAIRRLAAILVADMVGYARLMGIDEEGTFGAFKRGRRELIDPKVEQYRGRIVKSTGDGVLAEFASAIHAVRCAVEVQTEMAEWNSGRASSERIEYRIGINVGDVILDEDDGDIHGDGVNLAVRLEGLADPGGICISRAARDQVRDRLGLVFEDMGDRQVRTSPARCVPTGSYLARGHPLLDRPSSPRRQRRCPSPTSRRSRCCRSRT